MKWTSFQIDWLIDEDVILYIFLESAWWRYYILKELDFLPFILL